MKNKLLPFLWRKLSIVWKIFQLLFKKFFEEPSADIKRPLISDDNRYQIEKAKSHIKRKSFQAAIYDQLGSKESMHFAKQVDWCQLSINDLS